MEFNHRKKSFHAAVGISDERFSELKQRIGALAFLSKSLSEAFELLSKEGVVQAEEIPFAYFLLGALITGRKKEETVL